MSEGQEGRWESFKTGVSAAKTSAHKKITGCPDDIYEAAKTVFEEYEKMSIEDILKDNNFVIYNPDTKEIEDCQLFYCYYTKRLFGENYLVGHGFIPANTNFSIAIPNGGSTKKLKCRDSRNVFDEKCKKIFLTLDLIQQIKVCYVFCLFNKGNIKNGSLLYKNNRNYDKYLSDQKYIIINNKPILVGMLCKFYAEYKNKISGENDGKGDSGENLYKNDGNIENLGENLGENLDNKDLKNSSETGIVDNEIYGMWMRGDDERGGAKRKSKKRSKKHRKTKRRRHTRR